MFASLSGIMALLVQCLSFVSPAGFVGAPPAPASAAPTSQAVCPAATTATATCLSWVRAGSDHKVKSAAAPKALPAGYGPTQLRTAYGYTTSGTGALAVVTAYDNPDAASDLAKYDQAYGLPTFPACSKTVTASCFTKMSQTGSTSFLPARNRSWAVEADLDVQLAHAMCPSCKLTLVEANNASFSNLLAAVDRATTLGAHVVSMSWGAGEFSGETSYDSHFTNANVNYVAASGDSGYGPGWPAASAQVLSAGGTHLTLNSDNTRSSETVWNGSGSGCSRYEAKPAWQTDAATCARRTMNDLAADADPNTGAAIYSGYSPYGSGWLQIGGTSLSSPLIAGLISDAPAAPQTTLLQNLYAALGSPNLYDVTAGSNGTCQPNAYLCTAGSGFDGPTGVGSPIGLGAL